MNWQCESRFFGGYFTDRDRGKLPIGDGGRPAREVKVRAQSVIRTSMTTTSKGCPMGPWYGTL